MLNSVLYSLVVWFFSPKKKEEKKKDKNFILCHNLLSIVVSNSLGERI